MILISGNEFFSMKLTKKFINEKYPNRCVEYFPENSTHPKIQVEKIQNYLKHNPNMIVVSFSPYVCEACNYYSRETKNKLEVYYNDGKIIENISNELNKMYGNLAEPIERMVWGNYEL